jgi:hypothetical protein
VQLFRGCAAIQGPENGPHHAPRRQVLPLSWGGNLPRWCLANPDSCTMLARQCRAVVNICFSYTSTQELQHAADEIAGGLVESHLLQHDVRPSLLQRVMHTKVGHSVRATLDAPPPPPPRARGRFPPPPPPPSRGLHPSAHMTYW